MATPAELYSIVIVGNMNPRIHHPAWYEAVRILSPEEARAALLLACTPMFSQFQLPGSTILCMQERWEVQTQDAEKLERMLDIAGRTFDTLKHTPIAAFGLNFHFVRPTGLPDVGRRLAELVNGLPLGRKATVSDSSLIVTTTTLPDRVLQETVHGAPEEAGYVRVGYNVQHAIKTGTVLTKRLEAAVANATPFGRAESMARANAALAHSERLTAAGQGK
jgi:hypothetical protein